MLLIKGFGPEPTNIAIEAIYNFVDFNNMYKGVARQRQWMTEIEIATLVLHKVTLENNLRRIYEARMWLNGRCSDSNEDEDLGSDSDSVGDIID